MNQVFSQTIDQEAQRLIWNHSRDHPCILSNRLTKHTPRNKENIKYEKARQVNRRHCYLSTSLLTWQEKGIKVCLREKQFS